MLKTEGKIIFAKYLLTRDGRIFSMRFVNRMVNKPRLKELKQNLGRTYPSVCLCVGGKKMMVQVHVLMLEEFVSSRPAGHLACHKDGNPQNNHIDNLYWGTPRQNMLDRTAHGRAPLGEKNKSSKLTAAQVKSIRAMSRSGIKQIQIAKQFGIHRDSVRKIVNGTYWKAELERETK